MMNLKQFRVTNFKSVEDSGWIETAPMIRSFMRKFEASPNA